jgi:hypothetical protein
MNPFAEFLVGSVVGAAVVGSSVQRTLSVEHGNVRQAVTSSLINSSAYFYSVWAISKDNYVAYLGTALGSTLLMVYMARKNKNEQAGRKDI